MELVHPEMVFLSNNEFWPNYLNQIKKSKKPKTKLYLIPNFQSQSGSSFKSYGGFY
jgi:3-deoxy-D-manno-octulosonic-acid transferase